MEAFEHVVRVFLETQRFAVTSNVKFPIRKRVKKASREEFQTHGYEVDLVAARRDYLPPGSIPPRLERPQSPSFQWNCRHHTQDALRPVQAFQRCRKSATESSPRRLPDTATRIGRSEWPFSSVNSPALTSRLSASIADSPEAERDERLAFCFSHQPGCSISDSLSQ